MSNNKNCPDCDARVGETHTGHCDVERCLKCGGQRLSCGCRKTKKDARQVWTGEWPNLDACRKFNLWCKNSPTGTGLVPCDKDDPKATHDLNSLPEKCRWDRKKQEWVKR